MLDLDFLDADKDGRLPPSIINLIFLLILFLGFLAGWFAHLNWSLRGEASQIVEDMKVGDRNQKELVIDLKRLDANIEAINNDKRFVNEDCLNYSNADYASSLRNNSREEEQ